MRNTIALIIDDAAHGDLYPLKGLLDYLQDKDYPLARLIDIGEKHFRIPRRVLLETFLFFDTPYSIV